jgi:hypothetical protein
MVGEREEASVVRLGRLAIRLDRLVYATVVLMSVLVVYDGWDQLTTFGGMALVIVAPIVALAMAHLFAEVMDAYATLRRPLSRSEWSELTLEQTRWLLAAVPPLVILGLGWISRLDARSTIAVLLWTGLATLVVLATLSGHRAGFRGWRLFLAGLSGGVVGLVVISLQIVLKPH